MLFFSSHLLNIYNLQDLLHFLKLEGRESKRWVQHPNSAARLRHLRLHGVALSPGNCTYSYSMKSMQPCWLNCINVLLDQTYWKQLIRA
jgi:hypothetical protein